MDILTLAMAKAEVDNLKKSGGVGYTENSSTVVIEKAEREFAPIEDMGGVYGVIEAVKQLPSEYLFDGDYKAAVHFDGIDYRCELVPSGPNAFFGNMMLMGGEDTGEPFTIMVNTANNIAMMFAIDTAEKHTVGISFVKETVHTIDPKYLPEDVKAKIIDFEELGLTNAVLYLFNAGGGKLKLLEDNSYGADAISAFKAFPADGDFTVMLTIPNMGVMAVKPVYTLFRDGYFLVAHLDSYITSNGVLAKFYVRILGLRSTFDDGRSIIEGISVEVGFY